MELLLFISVIFLKIIRHLCFKFLFFYFFIFLGGGGGGEGVYTIILSLTRISDYYIFSYRASLKKYTWRKNDGKGTSQSTSSSCDAL